MSGGEPNPQSASAHNFHHSDRPAYAQTSLTTFHDFWKSAILTDVTICVDDGSLPCHRLVLAKNPVFKAMFLTEMAEAGKDEIRLPGIRIAVLRKVVGYLYTGEVEIDGQTVQDLLLVSNMWQFGAVQDACEAYLDRHIDTCNCIGVMLLAKAVCCQRLIDRARNMITTEFPSAREDPMFLELEEREVREILDSEELVIRSEQEILTAVLKWVEYSPQQRLASFPAVLQCVRLTHLRLSTLRKLAQHPLVLEANECREMITNSQQCILERRRDRENKDRLSTTHEVVLLFGQQSDETNQGKGYDVICYDEEDDSWRKVTRMPLNLSQMSVAVEGDTLYLTGGTTDPHSPEKGVQKCAYSYSFLHDAWKELPEMHVARYGHLSAVEKGKLYVVGGQQLDDKSVPGNSVEMYAEDTNTWTLCSPCPMIPLLPQACVWQGNLYLIEQTDTDLDEEDILDYIIQCYNPSTDSWDVVKDPKVCLKAIGIYDNQIHITTQDNRPMVYNPVKMTTEEYPGTKRQRHTYTTGLYDAGLFQWWSTSHDYLYRQDIWELFRECVTHLPYCMNNPVVVTVDKVSFGWFCRDLGLVGAQDSDTSSKEGKVAEIVE